MRKKMEQIEIDEGVFASAKAGDEEAISAIYNHYYTPLLVVALKLTHLNYADSEDLVCWVFARIFVARINKGDATPSRAIEGYDPAKGNFFSWSCRILSHRFVEQKISASRQFGQDEGRLDIEDLDLYISLKPTVLDDMLAELRKERLRNLLCRVSSEYLPMYLYGLEEDLSMGELANHFGRNEAGLKSGIFRLRQKLARLLLSHHFV